MQYIKEVLDRFDGNKSEYKKWERIRKGWSTTLKELKKTQEQCNKSK